MPYSLKFGQYDTLQDWGLYLLDSAVSVPETVKNYIDVPGRDGQLDLSEALSGRPIYGPRQIVAKFFRLSTPDEWPSLVSSILSAIHGKRLDVVLGEDPDWVYSGRVYVSDLGYKDGFYSINVNVDADPFKLRPEATVEEFSLTTTARTLTLQGGVMPVIPTITATAETLLEIGGAPYTVRANVPVKVPALCLSEGENSLTAKTTSGTGKITFEYTEGAL